MTNAVIRPWYNASSNDGSSCVDAQFYADGSVVIRNSRRPEGASVRYDAAEWAAFIAGVKAGMFDPEV